MIYLGRILFFCTDDGEVCVLFTILAWGEKCASSLAAFATLAFISLND